MASPTGWFNSTCSPCSSRADGELVLNPATPALLTNGQPLPGNKLTAHTVGLVDWNAKLDKSLLGARLVASTQKGWDEVLPFARVFDASLKTAATPDEEQVRDAELRKLLANLKTEIPQVENSLSQLATGLGGTVPQPLKITVARLKAITEPTDFREFDAAVRRITTPPRSSNPPSMTTRRPANSATMPSADPGSLLFDGGV